MFCNVDEVVEWRWVTCDSPRVVEGLFLVGWGVRVFGWCLIGVVGCYDVGYGTTEFINPRADCESWLAPSRDDAPVFNHGSWSDELPT